MKSILSAAALSALALGAATAGHASTVSGTSGTIYLSTATPSVDTSIGGPGDATFTPGAINYNPSDDPSVYTLGAFLNNPTFSNKSAAFATNGGNTSFSYGTGNTQIDITGNLFLKSGNNSFVVGHDDGVVLDIAGFGTVVNAPGPTALDTTPFTVFNSGAAGYYAFTLDYVESSGPPAALVFTVNGGGVPEPASWAIMLLGFGTVGAVMRRKARLAAV